MTLKYKTVVDSVTLGRDGSLAVRLGLLVVDGANEVSCVWHRFCATAGEDPATLLPGVLENIALDGYPALSAADVALISSAAALRG